MPPPNKLLEAAQEIATDLQGEQAGLEAEIVEAENNLVNLYAKRVSPEIFAGRLANFAGQDSSGHDCPRCWIKSEVRVELSCLDGDDTKDEFSCPSCGFSLFVVF